MGLLLYSLSSHDDNNYSIEALYLNNDAYYCIFFYVNYDSLLDNHEWIVESLKQLDFDKA